VLFLDMAKDMEGERKGVRPEIENSYWGDALTGSGPYLSRFGLVLLFYLRRRLELIGS